MQLKRLSGVILLALLSLVTLMSAIPNSIQAASAVTTATSYWVTVKPTITSSTIHIPVGTNWTVSFQALWSYGDNSGRAIRNATATIQVTNTLTDKIVSAFNVNTANGLFSFNYSSTSAGILKFSSIKLVTQGGTTYNPALLNASIGLYGLLSEADIVWWDTFHVSLVNHDSETLGISKVSVNVTYLLLPEEGLTPKIVHGANVTINGVKAQESEVAGIYTLNSSIWLPTSYVNVKVSQAGWVTTTTTFSFAHNANQVIWELAVALSLSIAAVGLLLWLVFSKKTKGAISFKHSNFPLFGGILLAFASVISLYWGMVGVDSTLHGFEWAPLGALGVFAYCSGFADAIMAMRKKNQAFAIFAEIAPFVTFMLVKISFDTYQLTTPWIIVAPSLALSILSSILIMNSDRQFT